MPRPDMQVSASPATMLPQLLSDPAARQQYGTALNLAAANCTGISIDQTGSVFAILSEADGLLHEGVNFPGWFAASLTA